MFFFTLSIHVILVFIQSLNSEFSSTNLEHTKSFNEIPGPSKLELIKWYIPGGRFHKLPRNHLYEYCRKNYGDLFRLPGLFGQPEYVYVCQPEHIGAVYRADSNWPVRRGMDTLLHYRSKINPEVFSETGSLLTSQGEMWAKIRTKVNPVMMQPKTIGIYVPRMNEVSDDFISKIKKIRDPKNNEVPDDFQRVINNWTMESIALVALDTRLGLLNDINKNLDAQVLIECLAKAFDLPAILDFKPSSIWRLYPTKPYKQLMKAHVQLTKLSEKYIRQTLERMKNNPPQTEEGQSVVERLIKIDEKVAVVMALELFFAGTDTTTAAFSSVLLNLAKNPDKQEILRKEVMKFLPDKDSPVKKDNLMNIPYLKAAIKESIRMNPVVSEIFRQLENDLLIDGYLIPKGRSIGMIYNTFHRSDDHFGEPNKFLPERWLRDHNVVEGGCPFTSTKPSNAFVYVPFGFGPRNCIGKRLVDMELEVTLSKLVRNFQIGFDYPDDDFFKLTLIYTPNVSLKFKFTDI